MACLAGAGGEGQCQRASLRQYKTRSRANSKLQMANGKERPRSSVKLTAANNARTVCVCSTTSTTRGFPCALLLRIVRVTTRHSTGSISTKNVSHCLPTSTALHCNPLTSPRHRRRGWLPAAPLLVHYMPHACTDTRAAKPQVWHSGQPPSGQGIVAIASSCAVIESFIDTIIRGASPQISNRVQFPSALLSLPMMTHGLRNTGA